MNGDGKPRGLLDALDIVGNETVDAEKLEAQTERIDEQLLKLDKVLFDLLSLKYGDASGKKSANKPRGAPPKRPESTNDAKRALLLYATAEHIRKERGLDRDAELGMAIPDLIEVASRTFPTHGLFNKLGARNKMYEKLKRGREIWGIDDEWRAKPLGELIDEKYIN